MRSDFFEGYFLRDLRDGDLAQSLKELFFRPQVIGAKTELYQSPAANLPSDLLFDPPACHRSTRAAQNKIRKVR
jgi:hypothetical protein